MRLLMFAAGSLQALCWGGRCRSALDPAFGVSSAKVREFVFVALCEGMCVVHTRHLENQTYPYHVHLGVVFRGIKR